VLVVVSLVATLGVVGAGGAGAATTVSPIGGTVPNGGALTPTIDIGRLGYGVSEFFVEGTADSYHNVGALTNTAPWVVAPDGTPQPYKTRIQVIAPNDPSAFNGTVYVEWFNVTAQFDSAPDFFQNYTEIKRQGAVYVGVSAQLAGVNAAKAQDAARYGSLVHPGDSYSYDIYTQVGQAIRDHAATIFGAAITPERIIAMGHSQSGSRLVTYVNAFGATAPYDGFIPRGTGATPTAALRQAPLGVIPVPNPTLVSQLAKPVLRFQTETEGRLARQVDSTNFRWWEVPGTAHQDAYPLSGDYADGPGGAQQFFNYMITPFFGPLGTFGNCQFGINAGPSGWVLHAALRHMNGWVQDGTPPPMAPRMNTVDGTPGGALVLDANGNVTGGIRTPHLDVPIAELRGSGNLPATPGINFCGLFGTTKPFSAEKLAQLYKNHGAFVSRWSQSVATTVAAGFMTPEDGELVQISGATSGIGKK
jgi:hypothetical protein